MQLRFAIQSSLFILLVIFSTVSWSADRWVIQFKESPGRSQTSVNPSSLESRKADLRARLAELSIVHKRTFQLVRPFGEHGAVITTPNGSGAEQARLRLLSDPMIESVEPDRRIKLRAQSPLIGLLNALDLSRRSRSWFHQDLSAQPASINTGAMWTNFHGTAPTVVAVLDTGVLPSHPMLQGHLLSGYDFAAESEAAFKRSRIVYEIRLGKTNARTLETRMNHAVGLLDMEKEQEALESFQVLAEIINATPNYKNEPIRAEILTFLGTLQMRGDQLQEAAKNYQTAFEVRQAAFGPNDIRTSQSLNNLGVVLYRAGDLKRAEVALSRAYIIRADALGNEDPLTLSTQKNLQAVIAAQNAAKTDLSGSAKRN